MATRMITMRIEKNYVVYLFAIVTAVSIMCAVHHIFDGGAQVGYDNDTAIGRCLDVTWEVDWSAQHYDIIRSIRGIIKHYQSNFMDFVEGHIDKLLSIVTTLPNSSGTFLITFLHQHVPYPVKAPFFILITPT